MRDEIVIKSEPNVKLDTASSINQSPAYNMDGGGKQVQSAKSFLDMANECGIAPDRPDDADEQKSPLDVAAAGSFNLGWIDEYARMITDIAGSPLEFNRLGGLVAAATAIGRKARLRMSFGDIYANIYGAIIAPSSVYHKSSSISKPRVMLQRAFLEERLLSELMTSEGLLKQLQTKPEGVIFRDEIGTLFSSNVKYLANLKPDLTALYDCYPYSKILSAGEVKVAEPYLNILGATTPQRFYEGVTSLDWYDGFLARWLFVMPSTEPNFDTDHGMLTVDHDTRIGRLAMKLAYVAKQEQADFVLSDDAYRLWWEWRKKGVKEAFLYGDEAVSAIVTRYATYALKVAIILAAINGNWGRISIADMKNAIALMDTFKSTAHRLLSEKGNHSISGSKVQKVFACIKTKNSDGTGITTKRLLQLTNMRKSEVEPCLDKLIEVGAIVDEKAGRGTKYKAIISELPVRAWK